MMELGTGPSSALDSTYGAMLIGLLFSTFFQGLLTVQTYNYYENYPTDPLRNKITVGVIWCLDTIHLVLIAQSAYHYLVTNWGYAPALVASTWEICIQLIFIGLSSFACQLFFLTRIWIFSKGNIFIVGFILAACLTSLTLDIVVTVHILQVPLVAEFGAKKGEIIAIFLAGAAADILIAGFMCYYLRRNQSDFKATKSLVGKILQYTVATGLATSLLAISSIIAYFAKPDGFYFIAIHFCLGRMYTNAVLATLNARYKMRTTLHSHQHLSTLDNREPGIRNVGSSTRCISPFQAGHHQAHSSFHSLNDGARYTFTIDRVTDRDDVELGRTRGIPPCSVA